MSNKLILSYDNSCYNAAVLEDGALADFTRYVEALVGNIYKARVTRYLDGIAAFFADIGGKHQVFVNCDDYTGTKLPLEGESIIIQISRPALGNKSAMATSKIKIAGEYLVYLPFSARGGISKKITSEEQRARLSAVVRSHDDDKFIVRSQAQYVGDADLHVEAVKLVNRWREIERRYYIESNPRLIYREYDFLLGYLRPCVQQQNISEIICDSVQLMARVGELTTITCSCPTDQNDIFALYSSREQIDRLTMRSLDLERGVRLIFDSCEALTAIDVNSAGFVGESATVADINIYACVEIARQIRLRNISGIIVVDFLKMDVASQRAVHTAMQVELHTDTLVTDILGFTRAGLYEIIRKRNAYATIN